MELRIPKLYDTYLREVYGDYMTPPSEDEQSGRHEVSYVDFGDYVIRHD